MPEIEVAIPVPLPGTFTYLCDEVPPAGTRVLVPFGHRKLVGVALGAAVSPPPGTALKKIAAILDRKPSYSPTMLELARWLSSYYMHPLGETLKAMLPASGTRSKQEAVLLTEKGQTERASGFSIEGRILRRIFGLKQETIALPTLKRKLKALHASEEDTSDVSLIYLQKLGLIEQSKKLKVSSRKAEETSPDSTAIAHNPASFEDRRLNLTPSQQAAFTRILEVSSTLEVSQPILLHGITGSGKTEIYLQLIAETLIRSHFQDQTLVLVPEISLTPQMTRVFEERFPGMVAVVHSAMTDSDRWSQLNRIQGNTAKILIGPRSAVFGPFARLRLILVDEEHDGSYKQSTGLTYHGRDVAVLRGRMEKALVVLGSATPSMETYQNALTNRYHLVELPERVTGRSLPEVELVGPQSPKKSRRTGTLVSRDGKAADSGDAEIAIAPQILEALRANLKEKHQAIVLVNRRGYSYYLYGTKEQKTVQCPQCSISLTLHARGSILRCHYCDYSTTMEKILAENPNETFATFGYGSQKAEDFLVHQVPEARITRIDSDAVMKRDVLPKVLGNFRKGDIDILVGTQILAKGHDFPNVTLIAMLEVDQLLALPDFRAGERTFQLIVQAAGRAGRAEFKGKVLIQCAMADHPVVLMAMRQDYKAFATSELIFRATHSYPPFARMIVFEFNSEKESHLDTLTSSLEKWFEHLQKIAPQLVEKVRILGPSTPPIGMIRGRHRRSLILCSAEHPPLRKVAAMLRDQCNRLPGDVRLTIDVDPQSLI